jgi:hypothetical protein
MKKSDEIANPTSCLNRAQDDEPIFVLRANDPTSSQLVRLWAAAYVDIKMAETNNNPTQTHVDKANEALQIAEQMENWHLKNSDRMSVVQ